MMVRVPVALLHALDQRGRDGVALDRQRVVRIALVDVIDELQIRFPVFGKARRCRERRRSLSRASIPTSPECVRRSAPPCRRQSANAGPAERIALAHVIAGGSHRRDDLVGDVRPADVAERSRQLAGVSRMAAVSRRRSSSEASRKLASTTCVSMGLRGEEGFRHSD